MREERGEKREIAATLDVCKNLSFMYCPSRREDGRFISSALLSTPHCELMAWFIQNS